jgi:uncharacterized protein with GYD domain
MNKAIAHVQKIQVGSITAATIKSKFTKQEIRSIEDSIERLKALHDNKQDSGFFSMIKSFFSKLFR